MIAIPNMSKPKSCWECFNADCDHWGEHGYDNSADCPLIEIDDELIKKLQESAIVIKAVFNRLKKVVNNSDELKTELMGTNPNLTIIDECVESVEK